MEEIVRMIVNQTNSQESPKNPKITLSVGTNKTSLKIFAYETEFEEDFNTFPTFMARVPEIIIIYILAQILKIYCASENDGPKEVKQAQANIMHKILVMKTLEKQYALESTKD